MRIKQYIFTAALLFAVCVVAKDDGTKKLEEDTERALIRHRRQLNPATQTIGESLSTTFLGLAGSLGVPGAAFLSQLFSFAFAQINKAAYQRQMKKFVEDIFTRQLTKVHLQTLESYSRDLGRRLRDLNSIATCEHGQPEKRNEARRLSGDIINNRWMSVVLKESNPWPAVFYMVDIAAIDIGVLLETAVRYSCHGKPTSDWEILYNRIGDWLEMIQPIAQQTRSNRQNRNNFKCRITGGRCYRGYCFSKKYTITDNLTGKSSSKSLSTKCKPKPSGGGRRGGRGGSRRCRRCKRVTRRCTSGATWGSSKICNTWPTSRINHGISLLNKKVFNVMESWRKIQTKAAQMVKPHGVALNRQRSRGALRALMLKKTPNHICDADYVDTCPK